MSHSHEIYESYLESVSMVQQQIDSYNRFIHIGLNKIVESQNTIEPDVANFAIKFKGIRLEMPKVIESDSSTRSILPHEAISRNLTYAAPMYITYVPVIAGIEKSNNTGEAYVGDLPVMVKSEMCYTRNMTREQLLSEDEDPDDPGGYFIIKGTERVLVGIEDLAPNKLMATKEGNTTVSKVFSTTTSFRARCSVERNEYGIFTVNFPTVSKGLELAMIVRALGLTKEDMLRFDNDDVKNDMLLNLAVSKAADMSPAEAIMELGRLSAPSQAKAYQQKRAETQLDTYILPHIGVTPKSRKEKGMYLLRMAERSSMVAYGYAKPDDKDHYGNKRVKLAGDLMEELFNNSFRFFIKDIKYHVERTTARGRRLNVRTNINPDTLTEKILYSMGTGSWPAGQTGVSEVLERTNILSTLAHLRRVKSPLAKKHPHLRARDVHGTHIGKLCPTETPEGVVVGLTRYLAVMAKVTVGADQDTLIKKLDTLGDMDSKDRVEREKQ
ncbi:MAG: DNA-directed RNA polymerase subunit B'' [Candidatus Marsarchaeota archaeon]|nr:DNA-directed RNA polymerase subunit B'' [Candidatus Marsarchaeota archaeon]